MSNIIDQQYRGSEMTPDGEHELLKVKIGRWRKLRSGWLVIKPGQIIVYRRKFMGGIEKAGEFEVSSLTGVEYEAPRNDIQLVFQDSNNQPLSEMFCCVGASSAGEMNEVLAGLLKEAEEKKRRAEEEEARKEKEEQDRLQRMREEFAREIWEASEALWRIAEADYAMVNAVITADWPAAREQYSILWRETDRLKQICRIELLEALGELDEAVTRSDGQETIKKAGHLLENLSAELLSIDILWSKWQDERKMLAAVSPNYNHLAYFLIFSASQFEALLSARIDDWAGLNNVIPLLGSTGAIIRHCFDIELDGSFDRLSSTVVERNKELFSGASRQIESIVSASFKARPFKFETQSQDL